MEEDTHRHTCVSVAVQSVAKAEDLSELVSWRSDLSSDEESSQGQNYTFSSFDPSLIRQFRRDFSMFIFFSSFIQKKWILIGQMSVFFYYYGWMIVCLINTHVSSLRR